MRCSRKIEYFTRFSNLITFRNPFQEDKENSAVGRRLTRQTTRMELNQMTDESAAKSTSILNLNEHCLTDIFAYFNITELLSLSAVCRRFYHVIQPILSRRFHTLDLSNAKQTGKSEQQVFKIAPMQLILQRFGSDITNLSFRPADFKSVDNSKILSVISKHCIGLKAMAVRDYIFRKKVLMVRSVQRMFGQLTSLDVKDCHFRETNNLRLLFENNQNLTSLKVPRGFLHFSVALNLSFPNLEIFFSCVCYADDNSHAVKFFERHPDIKHLHLDRSSFQELATLPKLESLSVKDRDYSNSPLHIHNLNKLDNLKSLKLYFDMEPAFNIAAVIRAMAAKNKLEVLYLTRPQLDDNDMFNAILCCKQLTALSLGNSFDWTDKKLKMLSTSLPKLKEVHFNTHTRMTSAGLTEFIRDSAQLSEIHMEFFGLNFFRVDLMEIIEMYRIRSGTLKFFTRESRWTQTTQKLNLQHRIILERYRRSGYDSENSDSDSDSDSD